MISRVAGLTITASALFLLVVAIMLNSAALFYMCTAMILTIGASRLQAWLSVRALRFERVAPETASQGERIKVEFTVWSERKIRRPLITVVDNLPARMGATEVSPSLPIAPAQDQPIRTQYRFRPMRRGKFAWSGLTVTGTDALGLVTMTREYATPPSEILVLPAPIPVSLELPVGAGWGHNESASGRSRGPGLEPYGVREYTHGDSLRFVHWRSSARAGRLLVREFETGSNPSVVFFIQRSSGSDIGPPGTSTLDTMCGHVAFLIEKSLREGAKVELPQLEDRPRPSATHERYRELLELLAEFQADSPLRLSDDLLAHRDRIEPGAVIYALMSVTDPGFVSACQSLRGLNVSVWPLLYDASAAAPRKRLLGHVSAASEEFIMDLQSGGMQPAVLPLALLEVEA